MDKKTLRIERLKQFAERHGVTDDPAGLGKLIGKKPNQVYNLLSGIASFGEKVARSIEDEAKLPTLWLDAEHGALSELPPDIASIALEIARLPPPQQKDMLDMLRPAVKNAQLAARLADSEKRIVENSLGVPGLRGQSAKRKNSSK